MYNTGCRCTAESGRTNASTAARRSRHPASYELTSDNTPAKNPSRYHDNKWPSRFCCVLWPSSVRGLATPWTYFLHLSLSSDILTDSYTGSPIHVLVLSIQAVRGLPRLRPPGIVPCIISFSGQLPCFLINVHSHLSQWFLGPRESTRQTA